MSVDTFFNQAEIQARDEEVKHDCDDYVERHPELKKIVSDFINQVLLEKPEDISDFAQRHFSSNSAKQNEQSPLIVCGPSGVGKGTLMKKVFAEFGSKVGLSVSHTTRSPREGEEDGKHYHFVSKETFEKQIEEGAFIEYAHVHNNIYGTSYQSVKDVVSEGKVCILEIDIQGAEKVKNSDLVPRTLYIAPPSVSELEKRLRHRGSESEEEIATRMNNAKQEMHWLESPSNVDLKVTNDSLDEAFIKVREALLNWYPQLRT
mmetsp:Transcript_17218/g.20877  ORF Transcript_17218/g.20877 Transcript_17218/m.20877 type:complete len:261 (-) Transcript_17218:1378-2160(-)